jgi:hypothetical protein
MTNPEEVLFTIWMIGRFGITKESSATLRIIVELFVEVGWAGKKYCIAKVNTKA